MNQVVAQNNTQLPAHLQHLYQLPVVGGGIGEAAAAGINSLAHHRISIRQARWRLNNPQGEEQVVQEFHLDVIFVDANPSTSKAFYAGAYDPSAAENAPPSCWSDNGIAPSDRVTTPASYLCANCPNNVLGSKMTPAGKKTKACADSKKMAVILAGNPTGPVYELRVPAASLVNMANTFKDLTARGIKGESVVVRLTFDPEAEYPKIIFTPVGYINPEQVQAVMAVLGTPEAASIVGKDDKPMQAAAGALSALGAAVPPVPQAPAPTAAPVYTAPQPAAFNPTPAAIMPTPGFALPPAAPAPAAPAFALPQTGYAAPIPPAAQPPVQVTALPGVQQTKKPRKPRTPKNPEVIAPPESNFGGTSLQGMPTLSPTFAVPQPAVPVAPAETYADIPQFLQPAAGVPVHPMPTNSALDSLLAGLKL